jgi:hypothetical protein
MIAPREKTDAFDPFDDPGSDLDPDAEDEGDAVNENWMDWCIDTEGMLPFWNIEKVWYDADGAHEWR